MFSIGPDVVLDSQYLDMGVVESGKFVAKSFKILNNTEVPAAFQVNYQVLKALGRLFVMLQGHLCCYCKYSSLHAYSLSVVKM